MTPHLLHVATDPAHELGLDIGVAINLRFHRAVTGVPQPTTPDTRKSDRPAPSDGDTSKQPKAPGGDHKSPAPSIEGAAQAADGADDLQPNTEG